MTGRDSRPDPITHVPQFRSVWSVVGMTGLAVVVVSLGGGRLPWWLQALLGFVLVMAGVHGARGGPCPGAWLDGYVRGASDQARTTRGPAE